MPEFPELTRQNFRNPHPLGALVLHDILAYERRYPGVAFYSRVQSAFVLVYFLLALSVGIISLRIRNQRVVRTVVLLGFVSIPFIPLIKLMFSALNEPMSRDYALWQAKLAAITIYPIIVLGFTCDVFFIAMTRRLVQFAGQMKHTNGVLGIVLLNPFLALFLISPLYIFRNQDVSAKLTPYVLYSTGLSNLFDVVLALVFAVLALTLLLHRLLWPLLNRTLFRMQDIGVKGRRAILMTVGLALLGWSGVHFSDLAREVIKALGKG